jgi:hypothetical protein
VSHRSEFRLGLCHGDRPYGHYRYQFADAEVSGDKAADQSRDHYADTNMRHNHIIAGGCVVATLGGCATYQTALRNEQGQSITCEASGTSLVIAGNHVRKGFELCVESAKRQGFIEVAAEKSAK